MEIEALAIDVNSCSIPRIKAYTVCMINFDFLSYIFVLLRGLHAVFMTRQY